MKRHKPIFLDDVKTTTTNRKAATLLPFNTCAQNKQHLDGAHDWESRMAELPSTLFITLNKIRSFFRSAPTNATKYTNSIGRHLATVRSYPNILLQH